MIPAVVLAALALLVLPGLLDHFGRKLRPTEWAPVCTASLFGGTVLLEAGLLMWSAPGVLRALGVPSLASACERVVGPLVFGGTPAASVAAVAATALPVAIVRAHRRSRSVCRAVADDLWLGELRHIGGHDVVVLPIKRPVALSFCAPTPTIVLSAGLLRALLPSEVNAVVRHEAAHLAHRHQHLLGLADVIASSLGWLPGIRSSTAALQLAVERSADEDAGTSSPHDRAAVQSSLLRLSGIEDVPRGVAAFKRASSVVARVEALARPAPAAAPLSRTFLSFPGMAASFVALPALASWTNHLHTLLAMAGRCPA